MVFQKDCCRGATTFTLHFRFLGSGLATHWPVKPWWVLAQLAKCVRCCLQHTIRPMPVLHTLWTTVLDAIYPPECLLCALPLDETPRTAMLCEQCNTALITDLLPACPRCGCTVGIGLDVSNGCTRCYNQTFHFSSVMRLGLYDYKLRDAVLRMKSLHGESLAETLGRVWFAQHRDRFLALNPNVVVPVPLHFTRRLRRGYNQAQALAEAIARGLRVPCQPRCLRRIRNTAKQSGLTAAARKENVKGAFSVGRRSLAPDLRILLVDDVMTTGATANAAAQTLRKSGAGRVDVAVLAHG